jgi:alpha-tubulin suppressor-like RCC1 family protein
VSVSSGGQHSCALTADGTAYCWGDNTWGQLGDSSQVDRANPTAVKTPVKFKSISAGFMHTCGLATSGAALCWGQNKAGELGDSTSTFRTQPRYIVLSVTP